MPLLPGDRANTTEDNNDEEEEEHPFADKETPSMVVTGPLGWETVGKRMSKGTFREVTAIPLKETGEEDEETIGTQGFARL